LSGKKNKTLNTITTGRYNIMLGDLELWDNNFLFGTGVGASKLLRKNIKYKAASHNEFSRLVAEHGLFGLTFIIILFYLFFQNYFSLGRTIYSSILVAMFFIGVGTMLHSSMRTFIPTIFISLSFLKIKRVL
jgi:cell division protein FtsW (lipid II flippase)